MGNRSPTHWVLGVSVMEDRDCRPLEKGCRYRKTPTADPLDRAPEMVDTIGVRRLATLASSVLILVLGATAAIVGQRGAEGGRGGSAPNRITGRVLDPSGRPVSGTFVTALLPSPDRPHGVMLVSARLHTETDEQGHFVLEGLSAGEYYVIAVPRNPVLDAAGRANASGHANTFHPNAVHVSDAAPVRVAAFSQTTANIILAPTPLRTVTGTVTDAAGNPVRDGRLLLARGDGLYGLFSGALQTRPDGSFTIAALQPGTYYLHFRESQWPTPRGVVPLISGATVVVRDADVHGVRVVPIPVVRGTGRIVIGDADRSTLNIGEISVGASPIDFSGNPGPQPPGAVKDDLTFEFGTWPGVGRVRVGGLPRTWIVKAIRVNGIDATDKPIDFVPGKDVIGIEIELTGPRTR